MAVIQTEKGLFVGLIVEEKEQPKAEKETVKEVAEKPATTRKPRAKKN